MRMRHEQGMLLLPVSLVLAIAGIAAYAATRESAMSVAAVDARYEYEAARYLAEAGVNLMVWQNAKRNCALPAAFPAFGMAGGTISADANGDGNGDVERDSGSATLAFTIAASYKGATYQIKRRGSSAMPFYDMSIRTVTSIKAGDGNDTFIKQGVASEQHSRSYIEVSDAADANAHGLIKFIPPAVPPGTRLVQADLELTLDSVAVAQLPRSLSVHRVTRDWRDTATWTSASSSASWTTAGGDYVATPAAVRDIAGANTRYAFPILRLAEDWVRNPALNYGVLLKPAGMTTARFAASDGNGQRPLLVAAYHPACP